MLRPRIHFGERGLSGTSSLHKETGNTLMSCMAVESSSVPKINKIIWERIWISYIITIIWRASCSKLCILTWDFASDLNSEKGFAWWLICDCVYSFVIACDLLLLYSVSKTTVRSEVTTATWQTGHLMHSFLFLCSMCICTPLAWSASISRCHLLLNNCMLWQFPLFCRYSSN